MLHRRSATRWPARMLGLAAITATSLFLAVGTASAATTFSNTAGITIPDAPSPSGSGVGQAESDITASGVVGNVQKVTATLNGFAHACPIDVDILLVGPQGQKSILMSDIGDCKNASRPGVALTFDDAAATAVPCILSSATVTNTLPAGTYQPTDASPTANHGAVGCDPPNDGDHSPGGTTPGSLANVFNAPAPPGPWGHSLATFGATNPNGVWRLFAVDQYHGDTGSISGGWKLDFTIAAPTVTAPTITGTPQVGQLLTANSGTVTGGGTPTYQWNACAVSCAPIAGATGGTYVPQAGDAGKAITVTEAVTNSSGVVATATSAPTATVAGANNVQVPNQTKATLATRTTKTKQKVLSQGGLLASISSNIDGNLVATATVSVPKLSKVYKFKAVRAKVLANNKTTVRLRLSRSGLKAVKKALVKHKRLKAKMKLTITTASGAVTTVTKTVRLAK